MSFLVSVAIVRLLLGAVFAAGAVNGFLILAGRKPFMPVNREATDLLIRAGYLYPLVKITELAAGILLLSGQFVPAGIALLAPIVVNIFFMHLLHDKPLIGVGVLLVGMELYLMLAYRDYFLPMLQLHSPL
ncbi:hypothetical protein [Cohnella cellulosilytica]|uniref:DoxX-like protein n=1 Tax=Cohnella cellulosilytica TaxID=986710 RepID=A0ABW2F4V6_9BACL